jgi:hypothetical protein
MKLFVMGSSLSQILFLNLRILYPKFIFEFLVNWASLSQILLQCDGQASLPFKNEGVFSDDPHEHISLFKIVHIYVTKSGLNRQQIPTLD